MNQRSLLEGGWTERFPTRSRTGWPRLRVFQAIIQSVRCGRNYRGVSTGLTLAYSGGFPSPGNRMKLPQKESKRDLGATASPSREPIGHLPLEGKRASWMDGRANLDLLERASTSMSLFPLFAGGYICFESHSPASHRTVIDRNLLGTRRQRGIRTSPLESV